MPSKEVGILVLRSDLCLILAKDPANRVVPWDESEISVCAIMYQPAFTMM